MHPDLKNITDPEAEFGLKGPKNPKSSSRQKYNRRKRWLAHALHDMSLAIEDLLSQDGKTYKQEEVEKLKNAILEFQNKTGLEVPELEPPTQEQLDGFMEMLNNLKPYEPPSKEELVTLYASINLDSSSDKDAK